MFIWRLLTVKNFSDVATLCAAIPCMGIALLGGLITSSQFLAYIHFNDMSVVNKRKHYMVQVVRQYLIANYILWDTTYVLKRDKSKVIVILDRDNHGDFSICFGRMLGPD